MGRVVAKRRVTRISRDAPPRSGSDALAGEEPLEIRVGGEPLVVTMRTPGDDYELAAGFLLSEGVIAARPDFAAASYCRGTGAGGANEYNVLDVALGPGVELPGAKMARNFYATSSCGVCGKASIDAVEVSSSFEVEPDPTSVQADLLLGLPDRLLAGQRVFDQTGGLHAAGIFDAESGEPLVVREDVGRHNALDKAIGWALMEDRLPLTGCVLQVSGRASFELVQKAWMAGAPVLSAVSAPSSLAADLATRAGMTLAGFVRDDSMVLYSRPDRIEADGERRGEARGLTASAGEARSR